MEGPIETVHIFEGKTDGLSLRGEHLQVLHAPYSGMPFLQTEQLCKQMHAPDDAPVCPQRPGSKELHVSNLCMWVATMYASCIGVYTRCVYTQGVATWLCVCV